MNTNLDRRSFSKTVAGALSAAALPSLDAAPARKLKIGCTCIIWNVFPRGPEASANLEPALKDISTLGFHGFEAFPENYEDMDKTGDLQRWIDKYKVPLVSGYCRMSLIDPAKEKDDLANIIRFGKIIKKYGGNYGVLAPTGVKRDGYDFKAHKARIVANLDNAAKALADLGLGAGLHQHTGTSIETRDEVYAVMESVNTKYMKFAPDVGQLQKGGADAAKVVKDFLPIVTHMHLKDYKGWDHFAGYCALGQGKVDLVSILDMLESAGKNPNVMVELDPSKNAPMTAFEATKTSKVFLEKLGYKFRA